MQSVREAGDELVIENQNVGLVRLFWILAVALAVWTLVSVALDRRFVNDSRFIGLLGGAGVLALFALFNAEHSVFAFDRKRRVLTWRRRWAFSRKPRRDAIQVPQRRMSLQRRRMPALAAGSQPP